MKQSVILALSATILASTAVAKPHIHQHLHKRDIVTRIVTEEVLEIVNVVIKVYGNDVTSTEFLTTQTTRHGASSSDSAGSGSDKLPPAVRLPSPSPSSNPPPNTGEKSPSKGDSPAHVDSSAQEGSSANGGSSPFEQQNENIRKQGEHIKDQNQKIKEQEKANEDQAKKNGAPQDKAAAPDVPERKADAPQQANKQATSGNTANAQKDSNSGKKDDGEGNSDDSAPSGGACGKVGGKCSGDLTIYDDQGAGACGWTMDTQSEDYFALSQVSMGSYSNNDYVDANGKSQDGTNKNAFCGRMAMISVNGKEFPAKLTDKCGGCQGAWDIDVSKSLWNKMYPGVAFTRFHNVEWRFTSPQIWSPAR